MIKSQTLIKRFPSAKREANNRSMKKYMKLMFAPLLFFALVSCSGPRLIEKDGYLFPSSEVRQSNEIRYKLTTSLDESNVLTFRLQNLSDFTWHVAREAFYPSHMIYDFFVNGFGASEAKLQCVSDIADMFGATETVEVNGAYERKFELEEICEGISNLKTDNYMTFYWQGEVYIYDSPKFIVDKLGKPVIGKQTKLGELKFRGKVKLRN